LLVLDKNGVQAPRYIEAPAAFMWHSLNAYERGHEIVAEFVGYDNPDHFIGTDPLLAAIMQGRAGTAVHPGTIRRYVIDLQHNRVNQETLAKESYEFPIVNPQRLGRVHRYGYFTYSGSTALQDTGIARFDMHSGKRELFDFGADFFVGEPIFVPRPGHDYSGDEAPETGWLIAQVFDLKVQKSFFALFASERLTAGPIARILLEHHVPISFHGYWRESGAA
jgi:all-trans-8'-apo-beta-carotenal 15,15'-oxygenase